jgi:methionine transaminase
VFHNTGWKIGYCIAPPIFTQAFRRLHQYLSFSVNTPAQYALAHFLKYAKPTAVHSLLENKRDYFLNLMKETPFRLLETAKGSYFQLISYAHLSELPDTEFAKILTEEYGVATIPISAFYSDKYDNKVLRFCFAKKNETIDAAILRLKKYKVSGY